MPQLIAMIIVIVGALIYMFQTFGGTGDKIEGIAQKTSAITEINNIRDGVRLAARSKDINADDGLDELAALNYFAGQINEQINDDAAEDNRYNALSFGGTAVQGTGEGDDKPAMTIQLVAPTAGYIPGIYVDFSLGSLADSAGFFESQLANDLESIAYIDRAATATTVTTDITASINNTGTATEKRTPAIDTEPTDAEKSDGKFIIYFKDFGANEVVK